MFFLSQTNNRARKAPTTPTTGGTAMSSAQPRNTGPTTPTIAPGPTGSQATAIGDTRRPSPTAQVVGTAMPRSEANTPNPPNASELASDSSSAARNAAQRARRRGAGSSVLSGLPVTGAPGARIRTRTLLGY